MRTIAPSLRDTLVRAFRRQAHDTIGFAPFAHQADTQLASEGWRLTAHVLPDDTPYEHIRIAVPNRRRPNDAHYETRAILPRPDGPAHHVANLGAYKQGKSYEMAAHALGYACLGDGIGAADVKFIGLEYKTSEHEFNYLADMLCSSQGLKLRHKRFLNDPRGGRMYLELKNGAIFECMSWTQKESIKGGESDAYYYAEAYQLPDIESFTTVAQNLRKRVGLAYWSSTCDRPWLKVIHERGHGLDPDWACTCSVPGWANAFTFDMKSFVRDCPDPTLLVPYAQDLPWMTSAIAAIVAERRKIPGLMTKERFEIAWLGKLGTFTGSVFRYQQGERTFGPVTHPVVFKPKIIEQYVRTLTGGLVAG